jgi:hypothetical protein
MHLTNGQKSSPRILRATRFGAKLNRLAARSLHTHLATSCERGFGHIQLKSNARKITFVPVEYDSKTSYGKYTNF